MKLSRSFFLGALGVLVAGSALAQFGTNYPMSITANTAFGTNAPGSLTASNRFGTNALGWLTASNYFGTNAPGSLTASNRFGTNAPGWLTASNSFGTNAPGWLMASNSFGTNAPGFLTASNSFGTNHPGSLTATNVFGTNAPGSLTASNTFSGGAQRVGVVSTNWVTISTLSTNLIGVTVTNSDAFLNGYYYSTNANPGMIGLTQNWFASTNGAKLGESLISNIWAIGTNATVSPNYGSANAYTGTPNPYPGTLEPYPGALQVINWGGNPNFPAYTNLPTIIPVFSVFTNTTTTNYTYTTNYP